MLKKYWFNIFVFFFVRPRTESDPLYNSLYVKNLNQIFHVHPVPHSKL